MGWVRGDNDITIQNLISALHHDLWKGKGYQKPVLSSSTKINLKTTLAGMIDGRTGKLDKPPSPAMSNTTTEEHDTKCPKCSGRKISPDPVKLCPKCGHANCEQSGGCEMCHTSLSGICAEAGKCGMCKGTGK